MPTRHPAADANRRRDTTSARALRQASAPCGVFRCDRCDRVVPDSLLVVQDGYSLCRTLCADASSVSEIALQLAKDSAVVDSYAPNADPPTNAFDGAVTITSHTAFPVRLTNGGASVAISITGVGFTSDIAISYDDVGLTNNTAPVITATTIALDIEAGAPIEASHGLHHITIAGTALRNALLVVA